MRVHRGRRGEQFARKGRRPLHVLLAALVLLAAGALLLDARLRPTVAALAGAELEAIINDEVNRACAEDAGEQAAYSELVRFQYDRQGNLLGLSTNMSGLNLLRANLTDRVEQRLIHVNRTEIAVPLGSVFGVSMLSGTGPMLPVQILHVNRINSRFESRFQAAGINQTRHQIEMVITVDVVLLLPGGSCEERCDNRITVAESVLMGDVPSHYSYFSQFDSVSDASDAERDYGMNQD